MYRERRYARDGKWHSWYECCPVIRDSGSTIDVLFENFPDAPLYPGGMFQLNRTRLLKNGKVYHSRHGEYFWLTPPNQGDLFPSSDVMNMPDFVTLEAEQLGWDISKPVYSWDEWQRLCWLLASLRKEPLQHFVKRWTTGGFSRLESLLSQGEQ